MNNKPSNNMQSYFDYSFTDEPKEDTVAEDDFDDFSDPEDEARRFVRPRDRQVDKRVGQAKLRKAASKEYR